MSRSAVAYRAKGILIVAPVVRTTTGLGLEVEPDVLGGSPNEAEVAASLKAALVRSERIVPHPTQDEWKGFFKPFQDAVGVRSHKAFMQDARRVSIRVVGDQLKLTPQRNLGPKDGFEPIQDQALLISPDDEKGIAAALLRMLD